MSCMKTSSSVSFVKAGECLYRNPTSGTYFARVKVRGKEIKRSLETTNLREARRKLKDLRISAERLDPATNPIALNTLNENLKRLPRFFLPIEALAFLAESHSIFCLVKSECVPYLQCL